MKNIWKYLKGKKRIISLVVLIANAGVSAFFPNTLTPEIYNWINLAGSAVGGVGVWDAVQDNLKKSKTVNK